jgi:hypothetical protein
MFKDRRLVIATKHEKEKVIAPILEKELGVNCFVIPDFNSDAFGTFTGEIERSEDPIETARKKCLLAMELSNCNLAVASEGSFGPHPSFFFMHADDEFLLFIDKKNKLEIIVRELSTTTNFYGETIHSIAELEAFTNQVLFPSHAVIIRKNENDFTSMVKGITSMEKLIKVFTNFAKNHGSIYIETDMRAMYNPTRMGVIELATQKLVEKINCHCPKCYAPGFGITAANKGLPCELCRFPTRSTLSHTYSCQKCSYSKEEMYPNNKQFEDATYCDFCNP